MSFLSSLQRIKQHIWFGPPLIFNNTQEDGIVAFLSSEGNPHDLGIVSVSVSSTDPESPFQKQEILMKDAYLKNRWYTKPEDPLGFWWMIDFNDSYVEAFQYTMKEYRDTSYLPINWTLTGSVDGNLWVELDHQNDPTIFKLHTNQMRSFPISKIQKVRFLKIEHFGVNQHGGKDLVLAGFDLHGVLSPRHLATHKHFRLKRYFFLSAFIPLL